MKTTSISNLQFSATTTSHDATQVSNQVVSSNAEPLILVDTNDQQIGVLDKQRCHDGVGTLHRAFSLFVFDDAGRMLLQQRASNKRLWPNFWSNACCSHPRDGESIEIAVQRRAQQELGLSLSPNFVYKFEYQAKFASLGSEHELCSVFLATCDPQQKLALSPNKTEISAWAWVPLAELHAEMASQADKFTPWFKLEIDTLLQNYSEQLNKFVQPS